MARIANLLLLCCSALLGLGCGEASMKLGLHTRSAIYGNTVLERDGGARAILTAKPPRVGTLQGVSPGAPLRGLGVFASDAVRIGLHRTCPNATVLTGPTTTALATRAGRSRELQTLLENANNTGILAAEDLAALGKATGLDYFFLGTIAWINISNATRLNPLGLTIVRSDWTNMNMVLQLYHAPTGEIVWQSVGDCTGYTESTAAIPISVHVVTSDLGEAMLNDLLAGRSRTTLFGTGNEPLRMEPEHQQAGGNAQGNNSQKDADAYAPANQPEIEPEAPPLRAP
jgi:hypothetical protein